MASYYCSWAKRVVRSTYSSGASHKWYSLINTKQPNLTQWMMLGVISIFGGRVTDYVRTIMEWRLIYSAECLYSRWRLILYSASSETSKHQWTHSRKRTFRVRLTDELKNNRQFWIPRTDECGGERESCVGWKKKERKRAQFQYVILAKHLLVPIVKSPNLFHRGSNQTQNCCCYPQHVLPRQ